MASVSSRQEVGMCCGTGSGNEELLAPEQHSQSRIAGNNSEQAIVLCSDWGIRQNRPFLAVSGKRILENSPRCVCWALPSALKGSALPASGLGDMERP